MLREPPHNLEAEQAVIGALLIDNDAYHRVSPFLLEEHFFPSEHGKLYAAAARLINAGRRATPITLKHEASDPKYLGQLAAAAVPPYMAEDMGKVIRDLASRRALIKIGEELAEQAYAALVDATVDGMIETAETSLAALAEGGIQIRQVSLTEAVLMPLLDRCHRMMARSITHLESRRGRGATTSVTVRQAGQVNVDCAVINENQP